MKVKQTKRWKFFGATAALLLLFLIALTAFVIYIDRSQDPKSLHESIRNVINVKIIYIQDYYNTDLPMLTENQLRNLTQELHNSSFTPVSTKNWNYGWMYQLEWETAIISVPEDGLPKIYLKNEHSSYAIQSGSNKLTKIAQRMAQKENKSNITNMENAFKEELGN